MGRILPISGSVEEGGVPLEQLYTSRPQNCGFVCFELLCLVVFVYFRVLAALAALYLPLVTQSISDCHFRIYTQQVTSET